MYLWLKAFHIIFMVCWFAGIFYLPRLYVYHSMSTDAVSLERFKVMERRLYRGIMTPAAVLTILLGLWIFSLNAAYYEHALWMQIKLLVVFFLIVYHGYCGYLRKQFAADINLHSTKFYRWLNEIPVFALIAVVLLAVVKPW